MSCDLGIRVHARDLGMEVKVLVTQSCLTLCGPMDCSPPGPSVDGILQERILEWVAISPLAFCMCQFRFFGNGWTSGPKLALSAHYPPSWRLRNISCHRISWQVTPHLDHRGHCVHPNHYIFSVLQAWHPYGIFEARTKCCSNYWKEPNNYKNRDVKLSYLGFWIYISEEMTLKHG